MARRSLPLNKVAVALLVVSRWEPRSRKLQRTGTEAHVSLPVVRCRKVFRPAASQYQSKDFSAFMCPPQAPTNLAVSSRAAAAVPA